jgi:two-component system nitrate/nitrite response regulator NarL
MTIRILLIDDHTLFRSGVRALLQRQPDFEVVDAAADGIEGFTSAGRGPARPEHAGVIGH